MYFFPELLSYTSLKESLRSGSAKKEIKVIKDFHCDCSKHNKLHVKAIVFQEINDLTIKKCQWYAKSNGEIAISAAGNILIEAYKFYSKHPDWKVRVAVSAGLSKLGTKKAIKLLLRLIDDKHYGVSLSAIQALEKIDSPDIINLLQERITLTSEKRIKRLIIRAVERIIFGVNASNSVKKTLCKLRKKSLFKKIPLQKERDSRVYLSRKIFHGAFTEGFMDSYFDRWDSTKHDKISKDIILFNKQKLIVKSQRASLIETKKNKKNYLINLFFKHRFLIDRIETHVRPVQGEVYWAVPDTFDPKVTRPVLILKPINQKAGDFLVVPLTSDVTSSSDKHLIVEIEGKKSRVQIFRQKVIHQSLLLNKYGNISENDLKRIPAKITVGNSNNNKMKRCFFNKQKRFSKATAKIPNELYEVKEVSTTFYQTAKVSIADQISSKIQSKKEKLPLFTLYHFLKPEVRSLLFKSDTISKRSEELSIIQKRFTCVGNTIS